MTGVLRSEWTKFRSAPGAVWLLVAVVAVTVAGGAATAATLRCPSTGCTGDPAEISLTGIQLSQAVVAIVAALMVGGEYRTNMIHTTLAATPQRIRMLIAKTAVVAGVVALAGAVAVPAGVLVGRPMLADRGLTLALSDAAVQRAAFGSVLYLVLIALLTVGVAVIARDAAAAIGVVLSLLYVFAILAQMVPDAELRENLREIAPMTAGLAIQATVDLASLPVSPWRGLAVLAAWAFGSLVVGGVLLKARDA
ncbi:ABC transporter permease subunit [Actinoplanes sp. NEAU-A12]|uniref:ABC transporter permease subunit n=1 Tax=Actinoplanes sandaracinus TaxID=3045177 RepID=A0ABT6WHY4_9ACTN|nr:ABC transporter permease subunit [Actinoplanes sandaracinus]MDI6099344.1 ABC transporter permease subunit [Actinoplanes sandaracinus]